MKHLLRPGLWLFALLAFLTGLCYPLSMTGIAQLLFPYQANGSLLLKNDQPIGSALIGQSFDDPRYFWSRPSATASMPYNAAASGGSNLSPDNPALINAVEARIQTLKQADPENSLPIPGDLVTASGSGLDPHISPAAAEYQIRRIARARGLDETTLHRLIADATELPTWGFLGEARVNVLQLNRALDNLP